MEEKTGIDWRQHALSTAPLTASDVARRLGVSPSTARYYAQVLLERGYPIRKEPREGGEEYLWPPEVVEVLRLAYRVARAGSPRMSVEDALALLETAGRVAYRAREGAPTIPELVQDLAGLDGVVRSLRQEVQALRGVAEGLDSRVRGVVQRLEGEAGQSIRALQREAEDALQRATNPWFVVSLLALLSALLALAFLGVGGFQAGGWKVALAFLSALFMGGALGWLLKG